MNFQLTWLLKIFLDKDLSNFVFKIAEFDISNRLVIELVESEKNYYFMNQFMILLQK